MTSSKSEQLRLAFMRRMALNLAEAYMEFMYPTPFDEVFYPTGQRLRVRVEKYESPDDTQPMSLARRSDE